MAFSFLTLQILMPPSIILGLWPLSGVTTIGVTQRDVVSTLQMAIDLGITTFDTAFSYGYDGESDRALGAAIAGRRDQFTVFGKVGQRWASDKSLTADKRRVVDGQPKTLIADAETSLKRIGIERFDLLFLHAPDPNVEIEVSAEAIQSLRERGLCDRVGVSNVSTDQYRRFRDAIQCDAIQCPLNVLQTDHLHDLIKSCHDDRCETYTFWTLMKGLLSGAITRDHQFDDGDSRPKYEIFQGDRREAAHIVIDKLSALAKTHEITMAQLAIGWVLSQPGVTSALVGARRKEQIAETAAAKKLSIELVDQIEAIVNPCRHLF